MLKFWLSLFLVFLAWELVLIKPEGFVYWFALCLLASIAASFRFSFGKKESGPPVKTGWRKFLLTGDFPDKLLLILFSLGVFWWVLWIDFFVIKFILPIIFWLALVYFFRDLSQRHHTVMPPKMRLSLFLGNVFFWSSIVFSLLTVLGWAIWLGLLIFLGLMAILGWVANEYLYLNNEAPEQCKIRSYLLLLLLSVELFAVIVWLPFAELTLALILTIAILFVYDLLKYHIQPELIRQRIIWRKILAYAALLAIVLGSTPWQ